MGQGRNWKHKLDRLREERRVLEQILEAFPSSPRRRERETRLAEIKLILLENS